jgi:hypothetical protein
MTGLTPPDVGQIIDLEAAFPGGPSGAKEQRMRDGFDLTPTRYYQRLGQILDTDELLEAALQHDATTTNRLRAARALRMNGGVR